MQNSDTNNINNSLTKIKINKEYPKEINKLKSLALELKNMQLKLLKDLNKQEAINKI
ncbi:MAG: hypothetical protein K2P17_05930 [Helicobacteraceae bacterium]|nr:hypothetical protein [Helicobacteraceae bacterium]